MKPLHILLVWIILTAITVLRVFSYRILQPQFVSGQRVNIVGEIVIKSTNSGTRSTLLLNNLEIVLMGQSQFVDGSKSQISGSVLCPEIKGEKTYICHQPQIQVDDVTVLAIYEKSPWDIFMHRIQAWSRSVVRQPFDPLTGQLMSGILLGGNDLPGKFKSQLARVGLSHIVAASGMNVTFVAGLVFSLLSFFQVPRTQKALFGILVTTFYGGITGFDPPIVRACLMSASLFLAPLFGRQSHGLSGLLLTGMLMLWVSPRLLEDFGFLLSFSSMMGQIALISLDFRVTKWLEEIISLLAQNLAATLVTLPIVVMGFNQFSLISTVPNLLVAGTVQPLMFLGAIILTLGSVSRTLGHLFSLPAQPILDYFLWVVRVFDRPEFVWHGTLSWPMAVGYYFFLAGFYLWLRTKFAQRRY